MQRQYRKVFKGTFDAIIKSAFAFIMALTSTYRYVITNSTTDQILEE